MENEFSSLQSSVSAALVATTRSASSLANEDLPFHRSLDSSLATELDRQNARLLGLATGLLGAATATSDTVRPPPSLKDVEGIENNWRAVVDVVDSLLERADTALDEFTGAVKRLSPARDAKANGTRTPKLSKIAAQLQAQDIEKPQLLFDNKTTNHEERPFKPLLLSKPHASVPLATEPVALNEDSQSQYPHPYQLEIEQYRYPPSVYTTADPVPYHPFDATTATFVDSEELLEDMIEELKQANEIAIDLEHHDQRSYIGLVSLMQISTRDKDWIVDTLKPWRRKLQALNEVFADPSIVKVLHGAYMDIVWLQRDLGLYIVGLFDTHFASRALGYAGGSLAFLLKKFANVDAQKQYQMADWRVRPLPQELFDYARSDTHYLLYIYDCMRNELIQRSDFSTPNHEGDKLWDVLQKSSETALQRYEHPEYDQELGQGPAGWYKMLSRTPALFTKEQFSIFRAVHKWRDDIAREQDDSVHYIMPNHQVFSIAREMPTNRAALLGIAQPTTQTVRFRADDLVAVVSKAKEAGKIGPEMLKVMNKVEPRNGPILAAKQNASGDSVAPYISKASSSLPTNGAETASTLPLRTQTSAFWGGAFESSAHDLNQKRGMSSTARPLELSIPLPALTAEVFAEGPNTAEFMPVRSKPATPRAEPTPTQTTDDDDVFVLKNLGKKRKRPAGDSAPPQHDGMAAQTDEIAIDDATEQAREKTECKKAKKEAKRAEKKARKAAESSDAAGNELANGDDEAPFDYAAAPSILNPPRESKTQMRERKKKEVNPYAKALDTPKGLPRAQRERAGRSMTYKSSYDHTRLLIFCERFVLPRTLRTTGERQELFEFSPYRQNKLKMCRYIGIEWKCGDKWHKVIGHQNTLNYRIYKDAAERQRIVQAMETAKTAYYQACDFHINTNCLPRLFQGLERSDVMVSGMRKFRWKFDRVPVSDKNLFPPGLADQIDLPNNNAVRTVGLLNENGGRLSRDPSTLTSIHQYMTVLQHCQNHPEDQLS
ncbi:exosome nuclease subunit [Saxophila tyrrhenica]|uniref:Exosome nuclease subunit n=1 Tax=Saxophila tyrrhenica TaxID=1690608 RepID=A0AAV9PJP4_9PEZI|nr:exosome nuclease subunit [Saxophila tyrrhenica]